MTDKQVVEFKIEEARFSGYLLDSIISLMIFDTDFLRRCTSLFKPQIFEGERGTIAELCFSYFQKYTAAPNEYIVDVLEDWVSRKPSQRALLLRYLGKVAEMDVNKGYVLQSFQSFIKDKLCADSITRASELQRRGKTTEAYNEIVHSFKQANTLTGSAVFNFLDSSNVNSIMDHSQDMNGKTTIEPYDKVTGGVARDEMILVFGDTNIGKSYLMVFLAIVFSLQGKRVLGVHLETSQREIELRTVKAITGMQARFRGGENDDSVKTAIRKRLLKKIDFLSRRGGKIWLKYPTGFTIDNFVSLLDDIEFQEGAPPDIVLLDSPKQMRHMPFKNSKLDNEIDLYQQLFQVKRERNFTLFVTAWSQRGKGSAVGLTQHQQVGGAIDKVQIVDTVWTLSQNEEENKRGLLWMFVPKARESRKFMTIELKQNLDLGQYVISAREVDGGSRATEEARRLGAAYEKQKAEEGE